MAPMHYVCTLLIATHIGTWQVTHWLHSSFSAGGGGFHPLVGVRCQILCRRLALDILKGRSERAGGSSLNFSCFPYSSLVLVSVLLV